MTGKTNSSLLGLKEKTGDHSCSWINLVNLRERGFRSKPALNESNMFVYLLNTLCKLWGTRTKLCVPPQYFTSFSPSSQFTAVKEMYRDAFSPCNNYLCFISRFTQVISSARTPEVTHVYIPFPLQPNEGQVVMQSCFRFSIFSERLQTPGGQESHRVFKTILTASGTLKSIKQFLWKIEYICNHSNTMIKQHLFLKDIDITGM